MEVHVMSTYDQINNIPQNSFQIVDVCKLPIYFDTTQNQSDKPVTVCQAFFLKKINFFGK